jgi:raffinose/stachyose/melibiose transport system substrate-binding protein
MNFMKFNAKKALRVVAVASVAALATSALSTGAQAAPKKTFNVWWYEKGTAMATVWNDALTEFKKAHPDVQVNFQLKTWAQLQNAGNALLSSSSAPDLSEWNKGNATAAHHKLTCSQISHHMQLSTSGTTFSFHQ